MALEGECLGFHHDSILLEERAVADGLSLNGLSLSLCRFPAIPRADLVRTGLLQGVGTAKER